jgi:hypothetical protein
MDLIPAPSRQFRTVSMVLLVLIGSADLIIGLLAFLGDIHVLTAPQLALANTVAVTLVGFARLIHQQVAMTREQKVETIAAVAAQPMAPGETDVSVRIDNKAALPGAPSHPT